MARLKYRVGNEDERQAAMEMAGGDLQGADFRQAKREMNKQDRVNRRAIRKAGRRGDQIREGYEGFKQFDAQEQRANEYFDELSKKRTRNIAAGTALAIGTVATAGALGAFGGAAAAGTAGTAATGAAATGATAAGTAATGAATGAAATGAATGATAAGATAAGTAATGAAGTAAGTAAATGATVGGTAATTGTVGTALTTGDKIIKGLQKGNEIYQEAKPFIDAGVQTYQALQPTQIDQPQVNTTDYSSLGLDMYQQQLMGFGSQSTPAVTSGGPQLQQPAGYYGSFMPPINQ